MSLLSFLIKNKLLFFALLAVPFFIFFISQDQANQRKTRLAAPIKRPLANQVPAAPAKALVTETPQSPQNQAYEKIEHRIPLSKDDFYAKDKILQTLPPNEESGTVYQSKNVTIEYIGSADTFQAEILTTDIASAKSEAATWFSSQGMSQEGICDAPLSFYLNYQIKSQLGEEASSFNPLPDGC
jgi:hypothetical protein